MKKIRLLGTALLAATLLLGACNNGEESSSTSTQPTSTEPTPPGPFKANLKMKLDGSIHKGEVYDLEFPYEDAYFDRNAKEYDKEMSLVSFGASMSTEKLTKISSYYKQAEFKDIIAKGYDDAPTKDTAGYVFASKEINNYKVVAITFRGLDYGAEWANNFIVGKTGDHEGFLARATEALADLNSYISSYCADKNIKLWINGYSRGGAIANVLSSLILRKESPIVKKEDMFVYTFEAPFCLATENVVAYENVHNIINKNDIITNIPPELFGFGRCGVDYPIYDENISALAAEFDEGFIIPEFTPITMVTPEIKNDEEFKDYIIKCIFNDPDCPAEHRCSNREEYVDRYQGALSYAIGLIFSMKPATRALLLSSIQQMEASALMPILLDDTGKGIADLIKPYLDLDKIEYDYDTLVANCATLQKAVMNLFIKILLLFASEANRPVFTRLIDMHYPESVYVLLVNAHKK